MAPTEGARRLFGEFLRARREEVTPESVGLPRAGSPRRVNGLRRGEVAQLARISTEYYIRLEQGKLPAPSHAVLSAIARALRLDLDQTRYLHELAGHSQAAKSSSLQPIPTQTVALLEALTSVPAIVVTRHLDVLAWNPLAAVFFTDFAALPVAERNVVRLIYLNDQVRSRFRDWDSVSRSATSLLRMSTARDPGHPRLAEVVDDLSLRDKDFRRWWTAQSVVTSSHGRRGYVHPLVGEFDLEWQTLTPSADPEQTIIVIVPADAAGKEVLRKLAHAAGPRAHPSPVTRTTPERWSRD